MSLAGGAGKAPPSPLTAAAATIEILIENNSAHPIILDTRKATKSFKPALPGTHKSFKDLRIPSGKTILTGSYNVEAATGLPLENVSIPFLFEHEEQASVTHKPGFHINQSPIYGTVTIDRAQTDPLIRHTPNGVFLGITHAEITHQQESTFNGQAVHQYVIGVYKAPEDNKSSHLEIPNPYSEEELTALAIRRNPPVRPRPIELLFGEKGELCRTFSSMNNGLKSNIQFYQQSAPKQKKDDYLGELIASEDKKQGEHFDRGLTTIATLYHLASLSTYPDMGVMEFLLQHKVWSQLVDLNGDPSVLSSHRDKLKEFKAFIQRLSLLHRPDQSAELKSKNKVRRTKADHSLLSISTYKGVVTNRGISWILGCEKLPTTNLGTEEQILHERTIYHPPNKDSVKQILQTASGAIHPTLNTAFLISSLDRVVAVLRIGDQGFMTLDTHDFSINTSLFITKNIDHVAEKVHRALLRRATSSEHHYTTQVLVNNTSENRLPNLSLLKKEQLHGYLFWLKGTGKTYSHKEFTAHGLEIAGSDTSLPPILVDIFRDDHALADYLLSPSSPCQFDALQLRLDMDVTTVSDDCTDTDLVLNLLQFFDERPHHMRNLIPSGSRARQYFHQLTKDVLQNYPTCCLSKDSADAFYTFVKQHQNEPPESSSQRAPDKRANAEEATLTPISSAQLSSALPSQLTQTPSSFSKLMEGQTRPADYSQLTRHITQYAEQDADLKAYLPEFTKGGLKQGLATLAALYHLQEPLESPRDLMMPATLSKRENPRGFHQFLQKLTHWTAQYDHSSLPSLYEHLKQNHDFPEHLLTLQYPDTSQRLVEHPIPAGGIEDNAIHARNLVAEDLGVDLGPAKDTLYQRTVYHVQKELHSVLEIMGINSPASINTAFLVSNGISTFSVLRLFEPGQDRPMYQLFDPNDLAVHKEFIITDELSDISDSIRERTQRGGFSGSSGFYKTVMLMNADNGQYSEFPDFTEFKNQKLEELLIQFMVSTPTNQRQEDITDDMAIQGYQSYKVRGLLGTLHTRDVNKDASVVAMLLELSHKHPIFSLTILSPEGGYIYDILQYIIENPDVLFQDDLLASQMCAALINIMTTNPQLQEIECYRNNERKNAYSELLRLHTELTLPPANADPLVDPVVDPVRVQHQPQINTEIRAKKGIRGSKTKKGKTTRKK